MFAGNLIKKPLKSILSIITSPIRLIGRFSPLKFIGKLFLKLWYLFFWLICVSLLYYVLYGKIIPHVHQEATISLQRTKLGYHSRLLSHHYDFPTCELSKLGSSQQGEDELEQKICVDPFNVWNHNLAFEKEVYKVTLLINAPATEHNYAIGTFPVRAEFISERNNSFQIDAFATYDLVHRGILRRIWDFLLDIFGLSPANLDFEVILSERFTNHFFNLMALNIEILEPKLVVNTAKLKLDAKLTGFRGFMHRWFWTASIFNILILSVFSSWILKRFQKLYKRFEILSQKFSLNFRFQKRRVKDWISVRLKIIKNIFFTQPLNCLKSIFCCCCKKRRRSLHSLDQRNFFFDLLNI